jgi:tRNA dimethylallyltransferase
MFKKLLIISGPTATGKTALAVEMAKKYNGELVSGDSCQIYKGLDIGTGKDHPRNIPIHLIDIINPNQKYSVAEFKEIGIKTINEIQSRGKLPILVGCSGFYIDAIINPNYNTFSIKPKKFLRYILSKLSVKSLQKIYKYLDSSGYSKLNNSDINNHYRLARKIEIKLFSKRANNNNQNPNYDVLHVSLTAPLSFIYQQIDRRVQKRIDEGFLKEVKSLLKKYKWTDPGLQIAAYHCLKPYFDNPKENVLKDCLQKWSYAEHSDAHRQKTWFKGRKNIHLIDITKTGYLKNVSKATDKWYNK